MTIDTITPVVNAELTRLGFAPRELETGAFKGLVKLQRDEQATLLALVGKKICKQAAPSIMLDVESFLNLTRKVK